MTLFDDEFSRKYIKVIKLAKMHVGNTRIECIETFDLRKIILKVMCSYLFYLL